LDKSDEIDGSYCARGTADRSIFVVVPAESRVFPRVFTQNSVVTDDLGSPLGGTIR
jgi:hypothetical protein